MNKFFEFQKYTERQDQRPYYRGVWDKLKMEQFRLLPFQYKKTYDGVFSMYQDATEITDHFFDENKITEWTFTETGVPAGGNLTSTGSTLNLWACGENDYITSNAFALTAGDVMWFKMIGNHDSTPISTFKIDFKFGATTITTIASGVLNKEYQFTSTNTGNHTIVVEILTDDSNIVNTECSCKETVLEIYEGANDYISYNGGNLYDLVALGESYFNIQSKNYSNVSDYTIAEEFFSEDCDVCRVNTFLESWSFLILDPFSNAFIKGKDITRLDNGDSVKSNEFYVKKGDVVSVICKITTGGPVDTTDINGSLNIGSTEVSLSISALGERLALMSATSTVDGSGYIKINSTASNLFSDWEIWLPYSDNYLTLEVESTVDYGGIHYADGFKQKWYKEATIRRSPSPQITVIGDDPDGVVIKEKVITATKYNVRFKVTEAEFNALLTATAGTVTIIDQTGHTFTCNSPELAEPSWSQGNGIAEFSFLDNVSIHTLNNSLL